MKTLIEMLKWMISFSWAQVYEGAIDRGEEAKKKALSVRDNAFWRFRYEKRTSYWSGTISGTGTDLIQGFPPQIGRASCRERV